VHGNLGAAGLNNVQGAGSVLTQGDTGLKPEASTQYVFCSGCKLPNGVVPRTFLGNAGLKHPLVDLCFVTRRLNA